MISRKGKYLGKTQGFLKWVCRAKDGEDGKRYCLRIPVRLSWLPLGKWSLATAYGTQSNRDKRQVQTHEVMAMFHSQTAVSQLPQTSVQALKRDGTPVAQRYRAI